MCDEGHGFQRVAVGQIDGILASLKDHVQRGLAVVINGFGDPALEHLALGGGDGGQCQRIACGIHKAAAEDLIAVDKGQLHLLGLLLNSDEETGSADSLRKLHFWGGQTDMIFVFEGGRKQDQFVTQRKGCNKYEIRVSGISAHAGTSPWKGANAIVQMGHLVTALDDLKNYNRGTSVNVGLISGGTALNVVPDSCTAQMEVRYSDPKEMTRVKHAIDKLAKRPPKVEGTKVEFELLGSTQLLREFAYTQKVMDKMRAYESQYRADLQELKDAGILAEDCPVYPVDFVAAGGLSDANRLAACHVPVIDGCGPGGGNPHRPDEYLSIDTVLKRFVFFTGLLPWMKGM